MMAFQAAAMASFTGKNDAPPLSSCGPSGFYHLKYACMLI